MSVIKPLLTSPSLRRQLPITAGSRMGRHGRYRDTRSRFGYGGPCYWTPGPREISILIEGPDEGGAIEMARSLMKRALELLDGAGDRRSVPHLQHALDVLDGHVVREPTPEEIERILGESWGS